MRIAETLLGAGLLSLRLSAADFYVSPAGHDAWSGTRAEPNAGKTDGPFATVKRAQAAVRGAKAAAPARDTPLTVQIRGGVYALSEPLVFRPEDSGTEKAPVVYEAFPGEEPVLSGGVRLTGWREVSPGRWEVALPDVASNRWTFSQLYVNDQRRYRPSWPKDGYYFVARALHPAGGGAPDRFGFRPGEFRADWANRSDIEVLTFHLWTMDRLRVKDIDEAKRIVTFAGPTHSADQAPLKPSTWYRIDNVKETLSVPGEWYLDRPTGVLTYLARSGENPNRDIVVAPRLARLVEMAGDPATGAFAENIVLRGLTFAHTSWNMPARGHGFPQADVNIDGAVTARFARRCALERCVVRHTGNWAVDWGDGCRDNRVEGCELVDLGAGGVKIGPTKLGWEPDTNKWASGCVVRDSLIARGGRVHPPAVGVWIGHAASNAVEHCEIADFYYSGVSVGWKWGGGFSPAHHNTIAWNHIHHVGQSVLSDLAGIYSLGESPGTTFHHNRIHDASSARYGGWGMYFDESSSNIVIEANLVTRTKDATFHQHYGSGNMVRNNIFAFGTNGQIRLSNLAKSGELLIERNIFLGREKIFELEQAGDRMEFRSNLYWCLDNPAPRFPGGKLFDDWRAAREPGAVLADPLFAGAESGDFKLRDGSPAAKIGFVPFDVGAAGRLSKTNRTDVLPPVPPAFRAAPAEPVVSKTRPIEYDFEDLDPGQGILEAETQVGANESLKATDETAASGKLSLKFVDGTDPAHTWSPHAYWRRRYETGMFRAVFDIRVESGARVNWETRTWDMGSGKPYVAGPAVDIHPDGRLTSHGRELLKLPHGRWARVEVVCGLGAKAAGAYAVAVTLPGAAAPARFDNLPLRGEFKTIDWIGFCSLAGPGAVYYIDNVKMGLE